MTPLPDHTEISTPDLAERLRLAIAALAPDELAEFLEQLAADHHLQQEAAA